LGRMVVVSTGAGVHRGYQHKACRIVEAVFGARDGDVAVFQRLPEHFEHTAVEFR